jgi:hypothetical protein
VMTPGRVNEPSLVVVVMVSLSCTRTVAPATGPAASTTRPDNTFGCDDGVGLTALGVGVTPAARSGCCGNMIDIDQTRLAITMISFGSQFVCMGLVIGYW